LENVPPIRSYTVGDEIRLTISIESVPHIESVTAIFRREDEASSRITLFDGAIQAGGLDPVFGESGLYRLRTKTFTAELVTRVDVDHTPGIYRLDSVRFRTESGATIEADSTIGGDADYMEYWSNGEIRIRRRPLRIMIEEEPTQVQSLTVGLEVELSDWAEDSDSED
jgi:hypothetical protein